MRNDRTYEANSLKFKRVRQCPGVVSRTFSVLEGKNKFEYEIEAGDKISEKGVFAAVVSVKNVGIFPREVICQDKLTCRHKEDCNGKRKHKRCYTLNECSCPA